MNARNSAVSEETPDRRSGHTEYAPGFIDADHFLLRPRLACHSSQSIELVSSCQIRLHDTMIPTSERVLLCQSRILSIGTCVPTAPRLVRPAGTCEVAAITAPRAAAACLLPAGRSVPGALACLPPAGTCLTSAPALLPPAGNLLRNTRSNLRGFPKHDASFRCADAPAATIGLEAGIRGERSSPAPRYKGA